MMIHEALERFVSSYPDPLPPDAQEKLLEIGNAIFAQKQDDPRVQAFWWANFVGIARWFIGHERERRAKGVKLIKTEARGRMQIGAFTLHGRADRIDRIADGGLSIVDYKTGGVPSKMEIKSGIEPQLPLLALIAQVGGFADIAPSSSASLEYWVLKGGRRGSKDDVLRDTIPQLVEKAEQGLQQLIAAFADPATPYEAVPRPRLQPRFNDYAHLARLAEWGRTGNDI
jgi:ATP-dependent helicase/nuclease subunit B